MIKSARLVTLIAIALVAGLLASGCGGSDKAADSKATVKEIKLGHIHPMTGNMAYEGKMMRNAILLAVEEINSSGIKSLGGAKITLLDGDSQGLPEKAVAESQRMIQEGAVALLGTYTSATAFTATQVAEKEKVPFIITVAVADDVMARGFKYSFRIQPNASTMARDFLKHLKVIKGDKVNTIGLIHEETMFGTSIANYIEKNAAEAGVKVVANIAYSPKAADLTAEVTKLKAANPDLVVATSYFQDGALLAKTIRERGLKSNGIVGVANGAFSDPKVISVLGDYSKNIMDVNYRFNPKSPLTKDVLGKFKQKFGEDMSTHAVYAYTATKVLADAIERAGSADREKIKEALVATSYKDHILPQGPIKFDEKGENINAQAVMIQIQDGTHKVVMPDDYAEAKPVFPQPQ